MVSRPFPPLQIHVRNRMLLASLLGWDPRSQADQRVRRDRKIGCPCESRPGEARAAVASRYGTDRFGFAVAADGR